jgi:CspA family cold shock protein
VSPSAAGSTSRGFDEEYTPRDRVAAAQPNNPRPSAVHGSEPVDAIVKWFNPEKGFGFVAVAGGSDAFIHVRLLEAVGRSSLPEGARVKVRIGQGQKGLQVSEVIEVDTSTAPAASGTERRFQPRSASQRPTDV